MRVIKRPGVKKWGCLRRIGINRRMRLARMARDELKTTFELMRINISSLSRAEEEMSWRRNV